MSDLLFVYGTLRGAVGHPIHAVLAAGGTHVGAAWTCGTLVRLEGYPGLLAGDDPAVRVRGEVWTVHDRAALGLLDDYEGEDYARRIVSVTLDHGAVMRAFAYVYTGPTEGRELVPGGDWLAP